MDKIRALEYFISVAESGSFSKAAKAIGVPASSISRRIQDLEADLGATLLHRTTRVVSLTEIGSLYLEQIRPAMASLEYADEIIGDQSSTPSGMLRITASPGYGGLKLLPAIKKLRLRYPELIIDLELTDHIASLASADVDIAIRVTAEPPERAVARKITDNEYILTASPNYIDRYGMPESLNELNSHMTLLYRGPGRVIHWQANTKFGWKECRAKPVFISNLGDVLVREAVEGAGLALLPRWGIQTHLTANELVSITLSDATLSVSRNLSSGVYLLYHRPKYGLAKIKASVDFLLSELR